jgi:hypothetical protein
MDTEIIQADFELVWQNALHRAKVTLIQNARDGVFLI